VRDASTSLIVKCVHRCNHHWKARTAPRGAGAFRIAVYVHTTSVYVRVHGICSQSNRSR
jgi:hypothetical protein